MTARLSYEEFLRAKVNFEHSMGLPCEASEVNPLLFPHQRDIVPWAVRGGRRAIFAAFGLGKSFMQLEIARLIEAKAEKRFLIVMPLGVRQEFKRDAAKLKIPVQFVRRIEECGPRGIYLTNYETVRDGKLDPREFAGVSLDEAAVLRGFGGTKTFREMMRLFEGTALYRFVATACPSPNEYIELLAYAAFLDVMDVGQAKTRFFKRDSTKADTLTLHPHKEKEFFAWLSTWSVWLQKPSQLGHSDENYDLPALNVHWHELESNHENAGTERNGQGKLLRNAAIGVTDAASEKRSSLAARIQKAKELIFAKISGQFIVWCDLNDEQETVDAALTAMGIKFSSLYGNMDIDERDELLEQWRQKKTTAFVSKPMMYGAGVNLQQCHHAIFLGIGFKFADFFQAIARIHRFLQEHDVHIHLIYTEAEREIRRTLEKKWTQHIELTDKMAEIIREYGLASADAIHELRRSIGCERTEVKGENFTLVNNDAVLETQQMAENSVHLILSSIPFSTQYEYTPSYNDFGHTDSNPHFFEQMDYLTPELLRVLKPGRVAAIHVKDRIVPGGMTGLGFQTVYPFHSKAIDHFIKHGFAFLGMKTIVTDVVRENNQTYRLGWTEQCKDGSRMGFGMPEYLLLFRKPPTDSSNGYADEPVVKDKEKYSRSRWQIDAHGFTRSNGNTLLSSEELEKLPHERIFKLFRQHSLSDVYDFEEHVALGEELERKQRLPVTFMLLQPQSWHPDVWTDITRMLTLNGAQSAAGREMHLCPIQFDLADRVIAQFTMEGETVFDPFVGIGSVVYRALKLKRRGVGVELSAKYFVDAVAYCKAAEQEAAVPSLFEAVEVEA